MSTFWFVVKVWLVLTGSYLLGVWGFCQIVGSIQTRQRGFLITITLWIMLLSIGVVLVRKLMPNQIATLCLGYLIALVSTLKAGKIE